MQFIKLVTTCTYQNKPETYFINLAHVTAVAPITIYYDREYDENGENGKDKHVEGIRVDLVSSGGEGANFYTFAITDEGVSTLLAWMERSVLDTEIQARVD